jgi:hypothetical protein
MHEPFTGPIFTVDGLAFHWDDVLQHARATGRWAALEDEVRLGLAAAAALEAEPDEAAEAAADAQADEFRYERGLLTAAEMEAWLAARGVSARRWLACMTGLALRGLWRDRADELLDAHPPGDAAVAEALDAELACTDVARELAEALAADAAAAGAARGRTTPPADRRLLLAEILEHASRFRVAARDRDAVAREIQGRRMDWIRLDCVLAAFPDAAQAREAVLCVREDRVPLADVAADAHVEPEEVSAILDDLEPDLRNRFLVTQPGEVIGPIERGGEHVVFHVVHRTLPEPSDPDLIERAGDVLEARAVGVEVERRVRWLAGRADAA